MRRNRSWHAGVWIAVAKFFLSATGLTWSEHAGATFGALRSALNADSIPLKTNLDGSAPDDRRGHRDVFSANGSTAGNFVAIATSVAAAGFSGPGTGRFIPTTCAGG